MTPRSLQMRLSQCPCKGHPVPKLYVFSGRSIWLISLPVRPRFPSPRRQSDPAGVAENMTRLPAPQETDWPPGALFTVGHSTLPVERFASLLHAYGIECLVD